MPPATPDPAPTPGQDDPVLVQRARALRVATVGKRLGYSLYAVAMVAFFAGYFTGFSSGWADAVVWPLVAGSVVLAPAIVLGYAVKAADRDDREAGRPSL